MYKRKKNMTDTQLSAQKASVNVIQALHTEQERDKDSSFKRHPPVNCTHRKMLSTGGHFKIIFLKMLNGLSKATNSSTDRPLTSHCFQGVLQAFANVSP